MPAAQRSVWATGFRSTSPGPPPTPVVWQRCPQETQPVGAGIPDAKPRPSTTVAAQGPQGGFFADTRQETRPPKRTGGRPKLTPEQRRASRARRRDKDRERKRQTRAQVRRPPEPRPPDPEPTR